MKASHQQMKCIVISDEIFATGITLSRALRCIKKTFVQRKQLVMCKSLTNQSCFIYCCIMITALLLPRQFATQQVKGCDNLVHSFILWTFWFLPNLSITLDFIKNGCPCNVLQDGFFYVWLCLPVDGIHMTRQACSIRLWQHSCWLSEIDVQLQCADVNSSMVWVVD